MSQRKRPHHDIELRDSLCFPLPPHAPAKRARIEAADEPLAYRGQKLNTATTSSSYSGFNRIKRHLREAGYSEEEMAKNTRLTHLASKPLPEESWRRIESIFLKAFQQFQARKRRHRYEAFVQQYNCRLLLGVEAHAYAFVPSASTVWYFRSNTLSATLFVRRQETMAECQNRLVGAVLECIPTVASWISRRISQLASHIPPAWPRADVRRILNAPRGRDLITNAYNKGAAEYDLACYVFKCSRSSSDSESAWHFGLDSLACEHCSVEHPGTGAITGLRDLQPDREGHDIVTDLIEDVVLNVGRSNLTVSQISPAFMDCLGISFFCETCTWEDYGWAIVQGVIPDTHPCVLGEAMDWRATIEHIRTTYKEKGFIRRCRIRWATEMEKHYISVRLKHEKAFSGTGESGRHWGCCHCTGFGQGIARSGTEIEQSRPWYTREEVERHIREVHKVQRPQEDWDFLWDRRVKREGIAVRGMPVEASDHGVDLLWTRIRSMQMELLMAAVAE